MFQKIHSGRAPRLSFVMTWTTLARGQRFGVAVRVRAMLGLVSGLHLSSTPRTQPLAVIGPALLLVKKCRNVCKSKIEYFYIPPCHVCLVRQFVPPKEKGGHRW